MSENQETTVALKQQQLEYLDAIAKKYDLPDRSKALRVLIAFAMQETEHEEAIFTKIRCINC